MKRFPYIISICSILVALVAIGGPVHAGRKPVSSQPPVAVLFGGPIGAEGGYCDPMVFTAVVNELERVGSLKGIAFKPDVSSIQLAVTQKKLLPNYLETISTLETQAAIVRTMGVDYGLSIAGSIQPNFENEDGAQVRRGDKVTIILDLVKPDGKHMVSDGGSKVPEYSGTKDDVRRQMAAATAASSAVARLVIQAFGQESLLNSLGSNTPPVLQADADADVNSPEYKKLYDDAVKQGDEYLKRKDLTNAFVTLRRAVNIRPSALDARLRLAEIYSQMGLHGEAVDECKRALLFNNGSLAVFNMLAKLYVSAGELSEAARYCSEIVRVDPNNVDAYVSLGDIYWNQSKITEAEDAYKKAVELDSKAPAPHEHLYNLYLAKKQYPEALEHLYSMKLAAARIDPSDDSAYGVFSDVVRDEFNGIMGKLTAAGEDFTKKKLSREDYYQESRDLAARIDAFDSFVTARSVSDEYKQAHPHASLATSLLAQSNGYVLQFLETDKASYAEQAVVLRTEARNELGLYVRAAGNKT